MFQAHAGYRTLRRGGPSPVPTKESPARACICVKHAHPSNHGAWGGVGACLSPLPPKEIQDRQTLGLGRQGRPSPAPPEKRQHRGWPSALHARRTSSCPHESRPPPQRPAPVCGRRLGRARARAAGSGPSASASSHRRHRYGAAGHVLPVSPGQAQLSSGCTLTRPAGGWALPAPTRRRWPAAIRSPGSSQLRHCMSFLKAPPGAGEPDMVRPASCSPRRAGYSASGSCQAPRSRPKGLLNTAAVHAVWSTTGLPRGAYCSAVWRGV